MIGHGGHTYGFMSSQGYLGSIDAAISILVNQDFDSRYPVITLCPVAQIIFDYHGVDINLYCDDYKPTAAWYACEDRFGTGAAC